MIRISAGLTEFANRIYTVRGTQRGELMGIPATGKSFTSAAIDILRVEGGKIAEHWVEADQLGMMLQLGVIPSMAPPAV